MCARGAHPARSSGPSTSPLEVTWDVRLREETRKTRFDWLFGYIGRSGVDRPGGVFGQRNRVRVRLAAASIEAGARALIGFVKQQSRLVRCAAGANRLR